MEPQARLRADQRASGVEAKAKSENHKISLEIPVLRENLALQADWNRRNENVKRQRTTSGSASSVSQSKSRPRDADSDNETEKPEKTKSIRGAAARNHRNKEVRDREAQREKERADALGGRKGRAERRRGDGIVP